MKTTFVKILTMTALSGLLAGCVQPDGRPDNTGTGALVGGASGAAIGALADRRNPGVGALIGGAAGLLAGGLIGHSVDQENDARARAMSSPPLPPPPSLADIKALARSGVSDDVIINQINNSRAVYHLDAGAIIDLNTAGVSQKVITYMINTGENVVATQAPPAPPAEVIVAAPGPDYVWVGGEWVWSGGTWVWVGGRWAARPYGHTVWVEARWERGPHGWYRTGGHWR